MTPPRDAKAQPFSRRHACRRTCRPASTSRRSRPGRAPSRASAPRSPRSSGSPSTARSTQPTLVTQLDAVHRRRSATSSTGSYLAHSVYGYFLNGGGNCYVVRIGGRRQRADGDGRGQGASRAAPARRSSGGCRIQALGRPGPAARPSRSRSSEAERRGPARRHVQAGREARRQAVEELRPRHHEARPAATWRRWSTPRPS